MPHVSAIRTERKVNTESVSCCLSRSTRANDGTTNGATGFDSKSRVLTMIEFVDQPSMR